MKYVVDIDGTICKKNEDGDYTFCEPFRDRIAFFNGLVAQGHEVVYYTARGSVSGRDWQRETTEQFHEWGVQHNGLLFGKMPYDVWIDDKAMNADEFFKSQGIE
jgi:CMP-N,N'-diacetyllegionaminic acid synthase